MPTNQYYMDQSDPGLGVGGIIGLGAQISAYDYFMLRGRAFSDIATKGIPQGVFGARRFGRYLYNRTGNKFGSQTLQSIGGFLSGQGRPFGMFAPNLSFLHVGHHLGSSYYGSANMDFALQGGVSRFARGWSSIIRPKLTDAQIMGVRSGISRMGIMESLMATPRSVATARVMKNTISPIARAELSTIERAGIQRGISRAAMISGVGRIAGGVLPVLNTLFLSKLAIDVAGAVGQGLGTLAGGMTRGVMEAVRAARGTEFSGSIEAFQTGAAITERQRALQAIQGSSLNARSYFGNEAQLYADTY